MNKIIAGLVAGVVLACTNSASALETQVLPPFKHLKWGMRESALTMPKSFTPFANKMPDALGFNGRVGRDDAAIVLGVTPKSRKLWRVIMILGDEATYSTAKINFHGYHELLVSKYGLPSNTYDYFTAPYEAGDGYENTALSTGNYKLISFWMDLQEGVVSAELTKSGWTRLAYESREFSDLNTKETNELASETL